MEIKSIIREIEISRVLNQPLDGDALVIQTFFDELFNDLEIITLDEYPDSILFIKNGGFYMEQDYKNERLYCSHDRVWSFFEENLSLDYQEISDLIKVMVEQQLKEKAFTPNFIQSDAKWWVEQQLKERVFTPAFTLNRLSLMVEQQLKERVFTPKARNKIINVMVDQHLKERVFTPNRSLRIESLQVEQHLKEKEFTPEIMRERSCR